MVALDKRIQKKRASLEALERGSTVASLAPVMHGTGAGDGIGRRESCTGRKQNRTGRKGGSKSAPRTSAFGLGESEINGAVIKLGGSKIAWGAIRQGGSN